METVVSMHSNVEYKTIKYIIACIYNAVCTIGESGYAAVLIKNMEKLYDIPRQEIFGYKVSEFFPMRL